MGLHKKKKELIGEARRLGIKISLPDVNKSSAETWEIGDDNTLLCPIREIKGIGEVASLEIVECREDAGLYKDYLDLESRVKKRKANKKVRELLIKVKAYEKQEDKDNLTEAELEDLSQYFDFELSNDPFYKFRNIIKLIKPKLNLLNLSDSYSLGDKSGFFFGRMESLRVGYREAVGATKDSNKFGSLGGVYGNLKDDSDFKMLIFGNKIYNEKKNIIEHCEGEMVLTNAFNSDDKAALMTQQAWFGDDILSGNFDGLQIGLSDYGSKSLRLDDISLCEDCELREQCKEPVLPSLGQLNVIICGEAPGKDEDREGIGFIGKSGKTFMENFI